LSYSTTLFISETTEARNFEFVTPPGYGEQLTKNKF